MYYLVIFVSLVMSAMTRQTNSSLLTERTESSVTTEGTNFKKLTEGADYSMSTEQTNILEMNNRRAKEKKLQFFLYTSKNPDKYQELKTNLNYTLFQSNYDFSKMTRIIVHGWVSNGTGNVADVIKNAYLQVTHDNIISVDWRMMADTMYLVARSLMPTVSQMLAKFLKFLVANGVAPNHLHLIGHSLGAHVVGLAGKYYGDLGTPFNAITGLDPAYPFFKSRSIDHRLDKSDAQHVEVIHTCEGLLGYPTPLGHVDFYVNGNKYQPGCGFDFLGLCAHHRVVMYFVESIVSPVPFVAVKCNSYEEYYTKGHCERSSRSRLIMSGLRLNYGKEGVYYLKTNSDVPFALGDPSNWKYADKYYYAFNHHYHNT